MFGLLFLYIFRLDPALIRPGRVDRKEKIDFATEHQLIEIFQRFYPEEAESSAHDFAVRACAHGKPISIAQVQGFFMMHKADPQSVLNETEQIWKV